MCTKTQGSGDGIYEIMRRGEMIDVTKYKFKDAIRHAVLIAPHLTHILASYFWIRYGLVYGTYYKIKNKIKQIEKELKE